MKKSVLLFICFISLTSFNRVGELIDSYNGVAVYFNGTINDVHGRHTTPDGYNLGLKWQCVEYVKRYYYQTYNHKMPNSFGHAKDLFDQSLEDVAFNEKRGLWQYRNTRYERPQSGDILVYGPTDDNPFGHTGIVGEVTNDSVELIQQNYGKKTRDNFKLSEYNGIITVADYDVLGWLRK